MFVETLWDVLGFSAKAGVVLFAVAGLALFIAALARSRSRLGAAPDGEGRLEVRRLRERLEALREPLRGALLTPKASAARQKEQRRKAKTPPPCLDKRTFVLEFDGDISASAVDSLRAEVTALLGEARAEDRVVLRVKSPGGTVDGYGLAASQVDRLRQRGLCVLACVDNVAASGGYMLACVASEIVAAPFAVIGSIGVVMPLPNAHSLLKRLGIDYENATAGAHKRLSSVFAEPSRESRDKLQAKLEETHSLFKAWIAKYRPALDLESVATGEYWPATRALELGLVDRIATSDDILLEALEDSEVLQVHYRRPKPLRARLLSRVHALLG